MNSTNEDICFVSAFLLLCFALIQSQESQSVCQTEQLIARCQSTNDVVMMTSAFYGRMRSGRCVDRNYGYVGCNASVLSLADGVCSGRRTCSIAVPNAAFESVTVDRHCPKDLKLYLEATYECIPVVTANEKLCPLRSNALRLTSSSGYISNVYTEETEQGSVKCPWLIQAGKRQRINVSLLDFGTAGGVTPSGPGDPCHVYAIVRERLASTAVTVCAGTERQRHVLLSEHEELEVRVQANLNRNRTKYFLLKYEFVGCAEPDQSSGNEFVVRWSQTRMEVGCKTSSRRWTLTCIGTTWSGEAGNCSDPGWIEKFVEMNLTKSGSIPWGASVFAVSVIALTLAVIILISGLMILRCHRRSRLSDSLPDSVYYGHTAKRSMDTRLPAPTEYRPESIHRGNPENEYSYIGDVTDPGPGHAAGRRSYDYGSTTTEGRCDGATSGGPPPFESPCSAGEAAAEKRTILPPPSRPSAYFELEPNCVPQKRTLVACDVPSAVNPLTPCCRRAGNGPELLFIDLDDRRSDVFEAGGQRGSAGLASI